MSVVVTVRETAEGTLVAAADVDCLGETYEDGAVSLTVEESFYDGEGAEELSPAAAVDRFGRVTPRISSASSVSRPQSTPVSSTRGAC
ncbi:MAG: hypothetical protein J07HB67_01732 [halophilic archaeon J07HB67]|jgi:Uncharacterized conserved protein|nr:MAG: hypothetical protein J07HB67_01732 [halophilic archaeon J07HB67]